MLYGARRTEVFRVDAALDFLRNLQTGDQSTAVTAAQGVVDQAQAALEQAQKTVEQSQASLDLLDAQIAKLVIYAPINGSVLTRNVEPGAPLPTATAQTIFPKVLTFVLDGKPMAGTTQ